MSFIICNNSKEQSAVNYTSYFRNEVVVPKNAKIGVYSCQINITPEIEINDTNNTLACMWDYEYAGQDLTEPVDNRPLNVKRYLPNDIVLRNGLYSVDELANEIYYALTWGDKCGLHQYEVGVIRDTNGKYGGFKINVNQVNQAQTPTVAVNMNETDMLKLHHAPIDQTITHPTNNTIKIEKTGGVADDFDCIYMLPSALYRDSSTITFKPHDYTDDYFFGLMRNTYYNNGEALKYIGFADSSDLPGELSDGRILDGRPYGSFCDFGVYIKNDDYSVHLYYSYRDEAGNKVDILELKYCETGLAGVDDMVILTGDDPEFQFYVDNEMVYVALKQAGEAGFTVLNRGYDWKGISSATMTLYPFVAIGNMGSYIELDSTQADNTKCGFLTPQGGVNSYEQEMADLNDTIRRQFVPSNYHILATLGWDYCVSRDQLGDPLEFEVDEVEENVFSALEARERIADASDWDDASEYLGYINNSGIWKAGSDSFTTQKDFYPYILTNKISYDADDEVQIVWQTNSNIGSILEIPNVIQKIQYDGTYPAFEISSDKTPENINIKNAYIRINNLPIQTYNGTNNSLSRIIGIVPRFNIARSIGHIYTLHNPPVYIDINNVEPIVLSQISLSLIDDNEALCKDISGETQIMFHMIS